MLCLRNHLCRYGLNNPNRVRALHEEFSPIDMNGNHFATGLDWINGLAEPGQWVDFASLTLLAEMLKCNFHIMWAQGDGVEVQKVSGTTAEDPDNIRVIVLLNWNHYEGTITNRVCAPSRNASVSVNAKTLDTNPATSTPHSESPSSTTDTTLPVLNAISASPAAVPSPLPELPSPSPPAVFVRLSPLHDVSATDSSENVPVGDLATDTDFEVMLASSRPDDGTVLVAGGLTGIDGYINDCNDRAQIATAVQDNYVENGTGKSKGATRQPSVLAGVRLPTRVQTRSKRKSFLS